jgi:hypothetical protein
VKRDFHFQRKLPATERGEDGTKTALTKDPVQIRFRGQVPAPVMIPHSVLGSELHYTTAPKQAGANLDMALQSVHKIAQ